MLHCFIPVLLPASSIPLNIAGAYNSSDAIVLFNINLMGLLWEFTIRAQRSMSVDNNYACQLSKLLPLPVALVNYLRFQLNDNMASEIQML